MFSCCFLLTSLVAAHLPQPVGGGAPRDPLGDHGRAARGWRRAETPSGRGRPGPHLHRGGGSAASFPHLVQGRAGE